MIVNVETTGLDPTRDKIIKFAMLPFDFSSGGKLYDVHEGYAGFEDPGLPVPETVNRLTGHRSDAKHQTVFPSEATFLSPPPSGTGSPI